MLPRVRFISSDTVTLLTEAELQKRVIKYARTHGIFTRKLIAVNYSGFPDLMLAKNAKVLFLELKNPKGTGRLSSLQVLSLNEMRAAGLQVAVCDTYDDAIHVIESSLHANTSTPDPRTTSGDYASR
jgi:hypothetical protein